MIRQLLEILRSLSIAPQFLWDFRAALSFRYLTTPLLGLGSLLEGARKRGIPMASRVKEDEKNERIIRGLLKLPANRRCINCNSLVLLLISISSSLFLRHPYYPSQIPTSPRLFMMAYVNLVLVDRGLNMYAQISGHSYVQIVAEYSKCFFREFTHRVKSISMAKFTSQEVSALQEGGNEVGDIENSYLNRGSKSPPYDDTNGRSYGERPGLASPAYNYRTSPGSFDRDNKSGYRNQERNIVDQQFSDGPKIEERSQNQQKDVDASKSPVAQPVGAVSNVPPAPIGDPAKPSGLQFPRTSAHVQVKFIVSNKTVFLAHSYPVPHGVGAINQSVPQQTASLPAESGGWASFDDSSQLKVTQVRPAVSTLESVLSQLSVPQTASAARTPSDLFTMTHPSTLAPFSYYQTSQRYMGYGTQHPTAVVCATASHFLMGNSLQCHIFNDDLQPFPLQALPGYSHSLTSSNPFAFVDEPKLVHASTRGLMCQLYVFVCLSRFPRCAKHLFELFNHRVEDCFSSEVS
ncbi:hypothetical protein BHM03_00003275 [Ensete ventricosum]|nr:hypothetical protein BHM03_00003275 [Ensete ventricosum]